ncbi:hypothetical protein K5V21_17145 [Clostridium sardiniense]|uniref:Uncharacterized protein n=1 Tax=Clostridium sardiniense TaxID=29369 RepID=A0ABS7L2A8_CLOSR|nr:hypothetical protein [Clostridium sardiniense]MBY0757159.1 hypothetical protein [Clostridium sardiniense]MDQ0461667.1 hypothetical protein [Clostridium sardiniense]
MFDNLAMVQKVISESELEVYTLDTKETKVVTASKLYVEDIKDLLEEDETIIVYYDKNTIIVNEDMKEI